MKILIIRNYPNYMDVKHSTYNIQELGLASALVRKGHICDIVFWTNNVEEIVVYNIPDTDLNIRIFYKKGKNFLKNVIFQIDDLIKEYDIIQPCEYNQIQAYLYAKRYPRKTVIYHGQYYGKENKKYNQWCAVFDIVGIPQYKKKETIFITKSLLSKEYLTRKGIDSRNIYSIGVGINKFALTPEKQNKSHTFYSKIDKYSQYFKLLYVGEYMPRRHVKFMGEIIKRMNSSGIPTILVTVGRTNSQYGQECIEYFEQLNIKDLVCHIEKIEQNYLSEIYKRCDCFLFPSTYEIFGMVLLEAMYFGLPVLATNNGGSSTLIQNGVNGIILEDLDCDKWVDAIMQVCQNKEVSSMMGNNARKTVEEKYTWDVLADDFLKVYKKRIAELLIE